MFGLLAPLLILAVAFGIDVTAAYRNALHLQALADRAALSAGPLWQAGETASARAVAAALVAADSAEVRIVSMSNEHDKFGQKGAADIFEITLASPEYHLLADLVMPGDHFAHASARGSRLVA
jgi:uncharacterized membrane protein